MSKNIIIILFIFIKKEIEMNMMKTNIKKKNANIYEVGKKLGIYKKEINSILKNVESENEHLSYATGPNIYWGNMYGVIGIKDFQ